MMNQLPVLIRREFWENRNMFLVLPAVITGFFMAMLVLALLASKTDLIDIRIDMSEEYSDRFEGQKIGSDEAFELLLLRMERLDVDEREQYLRSGLHSLGSPLFIVLWFVMVIYLLDTLYQDRRDRSILFWKSMPVSDTMTVVSKLLTVLLMVPLIYIACAAALQLFSLILLTMVSVGTDVSVWDHIWAPAGILSAWVRYVGVLLFYVFWALPFFGWLLVVSGFAKSVPLIWATGIPMGLMIVEALFTEQEGLRDWIKLHMLPMNMLKQGGSLLDSLMQMALSLQMVSALVVGGALIVVAIWLRGRADEI
jgi:ABC-2 type transport system permease protein